MSTFLASDLRGRGTGLRTPKRFEQSHTVDDFEHLEGSDEVPAEGVSTQFLEDSASSVISQNDSPDIPFARSLNAYRGCEHGCAYCYARPTHEYLGFNAGLDFESRIMVKHEAPALLEAELSSPRWHPQTLCMSGVTDCYQPVERKLGLTRQCLDVLRRFRNPVNIVTKNRLVTRDIDVLSGLAEYNAVSVVISITSLDVELARQLEPRASQPEARLEAISRLAAAGIPVGVNVAPIIPGLNDEEMARIIRAAAQAGAQFAAYQILRLPLQVGPIFLDWLERHYPTKRERVVQRLHDLRDGKLNDPRFGHRFRGEGIWAETLARLFDLECQRLNLFRGPQELSVEHFQAPGARQLELFG